MPPAPTPAQLRILTLIHQGHCTYTALAEQYGCDKKAAWHFVARLEAIGCVSKAYHTANALRVTDYGRYRLMRKGLADSVCPTVEVRHAG
jgi:DNA-binding IclR family transcriptional regulator